MELIRIEGLSHSYQLQGRPVSVLRDVNLRIQTGEMVAILGPSGSGKSTLLYVLGCLLKPTSGSYRLGGEEVTRMADAQLAQLRSRWIGFVFQQFHLLPRANLIENLLLGSRYHHAAGETDEQIRAKAKDLLTRVGLDAHFEHKPNELSGGQQQRVAIARALMNDPPLILADEPTGNLDSKSSAQVLELLREVQQSGRTVVIITHDNEVAAKCDRVITVRDGQVTEGERPPIVAVTPQPWPDKKTFVQVHGRESWSQDLDNAWSNLLRNKSRSILTMLGVTIGVAAVLATVTLGGYTREKILESYESLGVNKLVIRAYPRWNLSAREVKGSFFEGVSEAHDIVPMRRLFPEITLISPVVEQWIKAAEYGGKSYDQARPLGVNEEYFTITNRQLSQGKPFTHFHAANNRRICVIGSEVASRLFGKMSPLNQTLQMLSQGNGTGDTRYSCTISGVLSPQTSNNEWFNPNRQILMPQGFASSMANRWNAKPYEFNLQIKPGASIPDLAEKIKQYFNSKYGRSAQVSVDSDDLLVAQMRRFLTLFTLLLTGVAFISLAVGGIGIANMMLVSVAERFKEIGLRKALGATNEDIRRQFLVESAILCVSAGLMGVLIGVSGYEMALFFASKLFPKVPFEWVFNLSAMALSLACILAVSLFSGIVPAVRAQKLEVVEALRSE